METEKLEFLRPVQIDYDCLETFSIILNDLCLEFFLIRTLEEEQYARSMAVIPTENIDAYRGVFDVKKADFMLYSALIWIAFRNKRVPPVFKEFRRQERNARS